MLLAFAACALVWFYIRRASKNLVYELMVFGIAIVYLCIYPDAIVYPIDIVVNSDEAYRVSFSFTYPFTMEQYRNYEANLFYYLIRSAQPNVGSWGANTNGVLRSVACLP